MSVETASEPFGSISRQMNKMFEQMQRGYSGFAPGETWQPSVNLYETESGYVVCVDLAGVEKNKIDITVENQILRLRGVRTIPSHADGTQGDLQQRCTRVHLMEIDHGAFAREVELPMDVQKDHINAHYTDGLLWIELPRRV